MKPQQQRQQQKTPPPAAIEKAKPNGALTEIPDYLRRQPGVPPMGLENFSREDITLPRLGLCQALSPQCSESDPKYIDGLRPGNFFNSITRENYGKTVQLVPLLFYKTRILFGPMDEGGGLRCQAPDNMIGVGEPGGTCIKCPLSQFQKDGSKPECLQFFNYAALVVRDGNVSPEGLLVTSFKSSALKVAKDWNAFIRIRNLDIFAGVYEFASVERKNDIGRWFEPVVTPAGNVSREVYEAAKMAYAAVGDLNRQGKLRHDVADLNPAVSDAAEPAPF
jgi:hypothetical protein